MPERIQRKRTKGWRMPAGAIYVGRPTRWGNPFPPGGRGHRTHYRSMGCIVEVPVPDVETSVRLYRNWVNLDVSYMVGQAPPDAWALQTIRGHHLACWCPLDQPCHADVLLELANS